jgi:hypothetical protein
VLTLVGDSYQMEEFPDHEEAAAEQVVDLLPGSHRAFISLGNGFSTAEASGFNIMALADVEVVVKDGVVYKGGPGGRGRVTESEP